jgi:hypothetical protein
MKRVQPSYCLMSEYIDEMATKFMYTPTDLKIIELKHGRHHCPWKATEDLFLVNALCSQFSVPKIAELMQRTSHAIRCRMHHLFGHSDWSKIVTLNLENRIALFTSMKQKIYPEIERVDLVMFERVMIDEAAELYHFLEYFGFDGETSHTGGCEH